MTSATFVPTAEQLVPGALAHLGAYRPNWIAALTTEAIADGVLTGALDVRAVDWPTAYRDDVRFGHRRRMVAQTERRYAICLAGVQLVGGWPDPSAWNQWCRRWGMAARASRVPQAHR